MSEIRREGGASVGYCLDTDRKKIASLNAGEQSSDRVLRVLLEDRKLPTRSRGDNLPNLISMPQVRRRSEEVKTL